MFSVDTVIVSTLAEFKALNIRPNMVVAKGKNSIADGWGGEFYWYPGDATTADDDWVVQCTRGEAGRYRRVDPRTDQTGITLTTLASLKAMAGRPPSVITQYRSSAGDNGGGTWIWRSGDQSANVTADPKSGLWAAPDSDNTGASGAWQRLYTGERYLAWFDDGAEDGLVFQAAINSITSGQAGTIVVGPGTYTLTTTPTLNGRYPFFVVQAGASISGTFTLPYLQQSTNGANFDNGSFRIGSNDAFSGTGALVIGGADLRENGNGSYLVNDGHPNWNVLESTIAYNPTELNIYGNQTGGIASASGTAITRVSGVSFASWMAGRKFFYDGSLYTVDSVTDSDHLTLTSSAGTSSNKTFHFVYTTGSGTCNVSGTTVTRVTGEPFMPFINGTDFSFKINGVARTVSAYNSKDSLTLLSAPGDVTGATFTFEVRINDQISTLRIQKLAGSDEENLAIFAKPDAYYIAALYSGNGQKWPVYLCSDYTGNTPQPVAELAPTGKYIALGGTRNDAAARFNWVSSQVNYFDIYGGTTGLAPNIRARGSDTNVDLGLDTQGTGAVVFTSGSFSGLNFKVFATTSSTSYLGVSGSTSDAPAISANGSASNIDIKLAPKGTGSVWLGGWTSNADAAVNGYVTVKDSSGNVRKLATIA